MKTVYLYRDEGVDPTCLQWTSRALEGLSVALADRSTFLKPDWEEKASLVLFPGGRDIPYFQALRGEGNQRIREWVAQGGKYLGICAGAYYACKSICFEQGQPLEIIEERELGFFPGVGEGPALGLGVFAYNSEQGAQNIQIECFTRRVNVYYNGGCSFVEAEAHPTVDVLGRYESGKSAVVVCQVGLGKALLCGIHPEQNRPFFSELLAILDTP